MDAAPASEVGFVGPEGVQAAGSQNKPIPLRNKARLRQVHPPSRKKPQRAAFSFRWRPHLTNTTAIAVSARSRLPATPDNQRLRERLAPQRSLAHHNYGGCAPAVQQ